MVKIRRTSRSEEVQAKYDQFRGTGVDMSLKESCPFCRHDYRIVVEENDSMRLVYNDYPYEYFDGRLVQEHILLTPKRHVVEIDSFDRTERDDYWYFLSKYYHKGYSTLTRSISDSHRSVPGHIHTHLFKYY